MGKSMKAFWKGRSMIKRSYTLAATALVFGLLVGSCKDPTEPSNGGNGGGGGTPATTATVSGNVKDSRSPFPPVSGATVALSVPSKSISRSTQTALDGTFSFSVDLGDTLPPSVSGTLTVTKTGYMQKVSQTTLQPGGTTQVPEIVVDRDTSSTIGGGTAGGRANSIAFVGSNVNRLSVRGVGGNETAYITYEARDSLGFPITFDNRDTIKFTVTSLGGAYVSPVEVITNASGLASTTVNSGTVSGTLQIVAKLVRDSDGATIQSEPIRIIVHGGLPDQNHMSIATSRFNLPGLAFVGRSATITVLVGDKYSNPVAPNTAVYFSTSIGVVTTSSGFTNDNGFANVTLFTGNPTGINGFGHVKATTFGEAGLIVHDSIRILFSGTPIITYPGADTFSTGVGRCTNFSFTIADVNGNPISPGSTIALAVESSTSFTTSPSITMPDVQSSGPGTTAFTFALCDVLEEPPEGGGATVSIVVTWEGNTFRRTIATGTIGL
jgi:hypothetical protein